MISRTFAQPGPSWPTYGFPYSTFGTDKPGLTSYVGVSGNASFTGDTSTSNWDQWAGVFYSCSKVGITDVTASDGTANTLMYGEIVSGATDPTDTAVPKTKFYFMWAGTGFIWSNYGMPSDNEYLTFASRHTGIVNFVFCDGSVRSLRRPADSGTAYATYIYMSGYRDGRNFDPSQIGPRFFHRGPTDEDRSNVFRRHAAGGADGRLPQQSVVAAGADDPGQHQRDQGGRAEGARDQDPADQPAAAVIRSARCGGR